MLACTPRSLVVRTLIVLAACAGGASVLGEQAPQTATQAVQATVAGNPYLAAAIATGLAAIGAGIAVGIAGAAAIGAIAEKPELLGRSLIYVGLAEGIVIYGLIISFIILGAG
jgi:V/A-type H+/Na+-transporting ATPase subunit K